MREWCELISCWFWSCPRALFICYVHIAWNNILNVDMKFTENVNKSCCLPCPLKIGTFKWRKLFVCISFFSPWYPAYLIFLSFFNEADLALRLLGSSDHFTFINTRAHTCTHIYMVPFFWFFACNVSCWLKEYSYYVF